MKSYIKYIPWKFLPFLFVVAVWLVLVVNNYNLLYIIQDFSPLPDLKYSIFHPGGLREYVGDWLTQLFYYPWLGGTVMALMWMGSVFAVVKAFRLNGPWSLLSVIPVFALLTSITELGYWTFCLKAPSYWFGPTVGLLCVSLMLWLYNSLPARWRYVALALWILVGYPVLGWYATLGTVLMLISTEYKPVKQAVSILLALLLPCIVLFFVYHDALHIHWREPMLLYGFHHLVNPEASSRLLEVPFWVMAVSLVVMALIARVTKVHDSRLASWCISLPLFALALYATSMMQYRNQNFRHELVMLRYLEEGRWDDILQTMSNLQRHPTREMVLMKDVALAHQGRLGDAAFSYDYRGVRPEMNIDLPIHMAHSAAPYFYYWLGLPNFAFVWCMEDNIEYGLSPYFLKLMYRCSLANGEKHTAEKYRALLSKTLFYSDFHVSASELQSVHLFMTGHDNLTNDRGFSESFLMDRLSHERFSNAKAQQVAVYYAMLMRNGDAFKQAVSRLDSLSHSKSLPVHFREAQALFASRDSSVVVDDAMRSAYGNYCQTVEQHVSMGEPQESIGKSLYSEFGNTYWWYYDFYTNNKTY